MAALGGLPSSVEAVLGPPPRRPRPGSRKRYAERERPEPGWLPTAERFRDPTTGRVIRVFIDPADPSRHYVPDATG